MTGTPNKRTQTKTATAAPLAKPSQNNGSLHMHDLHALNGDETYRVVEEAAMDVVKVITIAGSQRQFLYVACPACGVAHGVSLRTHSWDGDTAKPTVKPSIKNDGCHAWLIDGEMRYLGDSRHEYANQVIALEPLPAWFVAM